MKTFTRDPVTRFFNHARFMPSGCVEWGGERSSEGYGVLVLTHSPRTREYAHRFAFMLFRGEIPEDRQLDHLCRNRACVRPDHLEALSLVENVMRGETLSGINSRKTACVKNHPFDEVNTLRYVRPDGREYRHCKACRRARDGARVRK